jgi:hypothetical protein
MEVQNEIKWLFGEKNKSTSSLNYYRIWVGSILIGISFL